MNDTIAELCLAIFGKIGLNSHLDVVLPCCSPHFAFWIWGQDVYKAIHVSFSIGDGYLGPPYPPIDLNRFFYSRLCCHFCHELFIGFCLKQSTMCPLWTGRKAKWTARVCVSCNEITSMTLWILPKTTAARHCPSMYAPFRLWWFGATKIEPLQLFLLKTTRSWS